MKILSIDIGGTAIKYALMDENASFLKRGKLPTPQEGREELLEVLCRLYQENPETEGIAISLPGIIDSENGYCVTGGALLYNDDFYLRHVLYEKCPVKIVIENDAKCAAMAEAATGSLKDVSEGLALIFGTMVGGGIIHDHKLVRGRHFSAGEVSYILPYPDREPRAEHVWGNCCGTPMLCRLYAKKKGLREQDVNGQTVFEAVHQGDDQAIEALDEFTYHIAVQVFNLQAILDPQRIAIGGGISAQPILVEYIRRHLEQLYIRCPYHLPHADVVTCKYQNDANLIGALQCFLNS